jgi:hypothetical protein
MHQYDSADAGNRILEEDRWDIFSDQEQPIALKDIEAQKVYHASIKIHERRALPSLRANGNEGGANGRRAALSFARGNISAQVEETRRGHSDGESNPRNRRGTNEGKALRGDRDGQTYLRSREGGGQGRRGNRRKREQRKLEEEEQDDMDEIVGNDEFERLDNFFDKVMLGELEQLQEALTSGPREQVYERLNQRKFEQNILTPTPTIARELSNSQDVAITAALLGTPSSQAPVRASPAAQKAILARQQRLMERRGEYRRWLPTKVQRLGGIDFAKLSGDAPVIGLQHLMAKKPEIGLKQREVTSAKVRTFLKSRAPELTAKSINPTESQQPAVSPHRAFSLCIYLNSFTDSFELESYKTRFNTPHLALRPRCSERQQ